MTIAFRAAGGLLALCVTMAGCPDASKKPLGDVCSDDGDCASGFCGGGVCLDPDGDEDGDTLTNRFEREIGSGPSDPDSDADAIPDRDEVGSDLAVVDSDGDGRPDIVESLVADADGDCIPDQLDAQDDVPDADRAVMVPRTCLLVGVCDAGRGALDVRCDDSGPSCVYDAVPGWEAEESTCDGLDNDCDGETDEGQPDLDADGIADCVDADRDGDVIDDEVDVCPATADPDQHDGDGDGLGDACDPPNDPSLSATDPVSPAATRSLRVAGTADPGAAVTIAADAACASPLGEGDADESGAFAIAITLPDELADGPIALFAVAENMADLASACVGGLDYTLDTTAPAVAVFVASAPPSPASDPSPRLSGTAEADAEVTLFSDAACDALLVTTAADAAGAFSAAIDVAANAVTEVFAVVTDRAGNASPCAPLTSYRHDDIAPAPPTGVLTPASPSNGPTTIAVGGCVEAGAEVLVYFDASCAGDAVATQPVAAGAFCESGVGYAHGIEVPADRATPVAIAARDAVGLTSACVDLGDYVHDSVAPGAPTFDTIEPGPIGTTRDVTVHLTAEPASVVELFATACEDAPLGTATADDQGAVTIAVSVAANATTTLSARAIDLAGNASACVELVVYTHDDIAPEAPSLDAILPGLVGASLVVTLVGAAEAGATIVVHAAAACDGEPFGEAAVDPDGAWQVEGLVAANTTTTFSARVIDAAENASACETFALAYRHDDLAPDAPIARFDPLSPSSDPSPDLVVCAAPGDAVVLYADASCETVVVEDDAAPADADALLAACATGGGVRFPAVAVAANASTSLWVIARDTAGNASACGAVGAYRHDDLPPDPPALTALEPGPVGATAPTLEGTGEAGASLALHGAAGCSGAALVELVVDAPGTWSASPTVGEGAHTFYGVLRDAAGNTSSCVSLASYTRDSTPPVAPAFSGKTPPSSPSSATTLQIRGTVDAAELNRGSQVEVYRSTVLGEAACAAGDPAARAVVAIGASTAWSVDFSLAPWLDQTSSFFGRVVDAAGNTSPCVLLTEHTHDGQPPAPPSMTQAQRDALAAQQGEAPQIRVCAETGSAVTLHGDAACGTPSFSASVIGTGACGAGAAEYQATLSVSGNSLTIYGRARDAADNASSCAQLATYLADTTPPAAPVLTASVSSWTLKPQEVRFEVTWSTPEPTGLVRLYSADDATPCAGAPVAEVAVGAGPVELVALGDTEWWLSGRVVDAAGNVGACSSPRHLAGQGWLDVKNSAGSPVFDVPVAIHMPDGSLAGETVTQDVAGAARATVWVFEGVMATGRLTTSSQFALTETLFSAELEPGLVVSYQSPQFFLSEPSYLYFDVEGEVPANTATVVLTVGCAGVERDAAATQPWSLQMWRFSCANLGEPIDLIVWAIDDAGAPIAYAPLPGVVPTSTTTTVQLPPAAQWSTDMFAFSLDVDNATTEDVQLDASVTTFTALGQGYRHRASGFRDPILLEPDAAATLDAWLPPGFASGANHTLGARVDYDTGAYASVDVRIQELAPVGDQRVVLGVDPLRSFYELSAPFTSGADPILSFDPVEAPRAALVRVAGRWWREGPTEERTVWNVLFDGSAGVTSFEFPELPEAWAVARPAAYLIQEGVGMSFTAIDADGWRTYREVVEGLGDGLFISDPSIAILPTEHTFEYLHLEAETNSP